MTHGPDSKGVCAVAVVGKCRGKCHAKRASNADCREKIALRHRGAASSKPQLRPLPSHHPAMPAAAAQVPVGPRGPEMGAGLTPPQSLWPYVRIFSF
eukprot:scaffold11831_cov124-Isochrysis_galbana.AAC.1